MYESSMLKGLLYCVKTVVAKKLANERENIETEELQLG
jgi:hypothetical protein